MIGPAIEARPPTSPNSASFETRSSGSNSTCIKAIAWGDMTAPAAPCSRRAATSSSDVRARPQAIEASVKPVTPQRKTGR